MSALLGVTVVVNEVVNGVRMPESERVVYDSVV